MCWNSGRLKRDRKRDCGKELRVWMAIRSQRMKGKEGEGKREKDRKNGEGKRYQSETN